MLRGLIKLLIEILFLSIRVKKFIELLRGGTAEGRDSAIDCLRTCLAPSALDAYPVRVLCNIFTRPFLFPPFIGEILLMSKKCEMLLLLLGF